MNRDIIERSKQVFTPAFHFYHPISIEQGLGCRITDVEGKSYLDCASGLGTLKIGHNHPRVLKRSLSSLTVLSIQAGSSTTSPQLHQRSF